MIYPLVRELAATSAPIKVPVAVTCRVLKIAKQPYYRWLRSPLSDRDWEEAQLVNAAVDAHAEAPTFGYRLIADELADLGFEASERRIWRLCQANGIASTTVRRRRGKSVRQGPPVHDDLVRRQFTATAPDRLWLTDITEHRTGEGKLYLCAVKDVFPTASSGTRSTSAWAPTLPSTRCGWPCSVDVRPARPCTRIEAVSSAPDASSSPCTRRAWSVRWAESARPAITRPWHRSSRSCRRTC